MVKFDGAFPMDILYMKIAGKKEVESIPLCEVFNGKYNYAESLNSNEITLGDSSAAGSAVAYSKPVFLNLLHKIFFGKEGGSKITDAAIQPEGETLVSEVSSFIEKYS